MTRRAVTALVLCALVGAGAAGGAHTGGTPVAFVAIPAASELAVVYLGTGRVLARVRVPRGPQELAAYHEPGGRNFVLVTSPAAGAVTMIDARTRRIVKVWRGFGRPSGIVVDALRAYVTDTSRGQLVVLDLRSRRIVARIDVGGRPRALAVGDLAVIADERLPSLALVAVRQRRALATVHRWRVVATCTRSASLIDWDTSTGQLRRTRLGGSPAGVAFVLLP